MSDGWQPDPFGRAQYRYHQGGAWTHHVVVNNVQSVEASHFPLVAPPIATQPQSAVGLTAGPDQASLKHLRDAGKMAIIIGILGMLAVVFIATAKTSTPGCPSYADTCDPHQAAYSVGYLYGLLVPPIALVIFGLCALRGAAWSRPALGLVAAFNILTDLAALVSGGAAFPVGLFINIGLMVALIRRLSVRNPPLPE